jgi:hypothetical protein
MKRVAVSLFAFVLCFAVAALTQDTGSAGTGQSTTTGTSTTKKKAAKLEHLKGKISDDGKTFTADKDNKAYSIVNPDVVKGHEGHDVRLSGHVDPSANSIDVTSMKMAGEKTSKKTGGAMSEQPPK